MADDLSFCRHPDDPDGCRRALVAAWREGRLEQHCVMAGLKAGCRQCIEVLSKGLYDDATRTTSGGQRH